MADVIPFRARYAPVEEEVTIDLLTAVDVAIRDLRDISRRWDESSRRQAEECRQMLEAAFMVALAED